MGEGKNTTHQQKKLNEDELREFRSRFGIPISDDDCADAPFYRPPEDSPEIQYLRARRQELGGYVPSRTVRAKPLQLAERSEEHTSELQSPCNLVCRLLLEKKNITDIHAHRKKREH